MVTNVERPNERGDIRLLENEESEGDEICYAFVDGAAPELDVTVDAGCG